MDRARDESSSPWGSDGALGVAAALSLQAVVWIAGLRRLRTMPQPAQQLCLLTALLTHSLLGLVSPPTAATLVLAWALYSLVLPTATDATKGWRPAKPTPQRQWAVVGIALLTLACVDWLCLRPAIADHVFARALRQGDPTLLARAQRWMSGQDVYFHQGGRLAAGQGTPAGFAQAEETSNGTRYHALSGSASLLGRLRAGLPGVVSTGTIAAGAGRTGA